MEKHDIDFDGNLIEFIVESIWVDFVAGLVNWISGIIFDFLPFFPQD